MALAVAAPGWVRRIALTAGGTATWIRDRVYKLDASGVTVLDAAGPPRVDHASLALAGTRAYWLRDGQPQSALLDTGSVQVPWRKGGDRRVRGRTVASNAYVRVYARENRPFSSVYYACELERVARAGLGAGTR